MHVRALRLPRQRPRPHLRGGAAPHADAAAHRRHHRLLPAQQLGHGAAQARGVAVVQQAALQAARVERRHVAPQHALIHRLLLGLGRRRQVGLQTGAGRALRSGRVASKGPPACSWRRARRSAAAQPPAFRRPAAGGRPALTAGFRSVAGHVG